MRLHFHSPTVTKRLQRGYNIRQIVTITSQLLTQSSARDIMFTAYAECSAQFFVKILKKVLTFRAICAIIKRVCSIISMRHTRHMKPCQIFFNGEMHGQEKNQIHQNTGRTAQGS